MTHRRLRAEVARFRAAARCAGDPLGPPSDFGWRSCHGCHALFEFGYGQHRADCPGVCTEPDCDWDHASDVTGR
jgi:hypothetical protein